MLCEGLYVFLCILMISHLSSLVVNDIEHTLKVKYIKVQNTTKGQTITGIVSQVIHRTMGNIMC